MILRPFIKYPMIETEITEYEARYSLDGVPRVEETLGPQFFSRLHTIFSYDHFTLL